MKYSAAAVERAMKKQEVILRAISGKITWLQAADILGMRPRSVRRLRKKYERFGYDGLIDHRRVTPSPKRAPFDEVQRILQLYRKKYDGFNMKHFHEIAQREHAVTLSYSQVKTLLHEAGLVKKKRQRGRHRKRRERKACFGEMVHIDGSRHPWLALRPQEKQVLVAVMDDATNRLLYAQLWSGETTEAVMTALWEVIVTYGLPMSLYSDRAGWAFFTPEAGGKVDKKKLTQVGRGLKVLGIEHIPSYSPQARGRSERLNRTLQDRLVNELRVEGVRTVKAANRYLAEVFIPRHNARFSRPPRDPDAVFVHPGTVDLNMVFCIEEERVVAKDNTVVMKRVKMQLEKQQGRRSCEGLRILLRRHLDGTHSVWYGKRCFGWFDGRGRPIAYRKAA